jgi:hypothetical protein
MVLIDACKRTTVTTRYLLFGFLAGAKIGCSTLMKIKGEISGIF